MLFVSYLTNSFLIQKLKDLHLFSSESFIALALIFRLFIHTELISVHGGCRSSNSFFACGHPVVPAPFVKKTVNGLSTLVETDRSYMALYLNSKL